MYVLSAPSAFFTSSQGNIFPLLHIRPETKKESHCLQSPPVLSLSLFPHPIDHSFPTAPLGQPRKPVTEKLFQSTRGRLFVLPSRFLVEAISSRRVEVRDGPGGTWRCLRGCQSRWGTWPSSFCEKAPCFATNMHPGKIFLNIFCSKYRFLSSYFPFVDHMTSSHTPKCVSNRRVESKFNLALMTFRIYIVMSWYGRFLLHKIAENQISCFLFYFDRHYLAKCFSKLDNKMNA